MNILHTKKLPFNRELFLFIFIFISILHLIAILFIYYDKNFLFLIIIELVFFCYYKINYKIFLRAFFISIVILILNLFFYEGQIIFHFGIIKITSEGLNIGIKRSGLLLFLFLFTLNNFKDKKNKILNILKKNKENNLVFYSVNYFLAFLDLFIISGFNKRFIIQIINMYKVDKFDKNLNKEKDLIDINYFIYNFIFLFFFICILFIKIKHIRIIV